MDPERPAMGEEIKIKFLTDTWATTRNMAMAWMIVAALNRDEKANDPDWKKKYGKEKAGG